MPLVMEIIDIFANISGIRFTVKQDPERMRSVDVPIMVGNNEKVRRQTGWNPEISLDQTLQDLLGYIKNKDKNERQVRY